MRRIDRSKHIGLLQPRWQNETHVIIISYYYHIVDVDLNVSDIRMHAHAHTHTNAMGEADIVIIIIDLRRVLVWHIYKHAAVDA